MRLGIDFDNTIACYDGVFHAAALELGLVPADLPTSKNAVRDYLNGSGRSDEFTALQGHVYGARMDLVPCYPGVKEFVHAARSAGHVLYLVSHKTRHPILGAKHDLHAAARRFLTTHGLIGPAAFAIEDVYFALTKDEKVAQAARLDCQVFIDDLPEILLMSGFPTGLRAILFDPENRFVDNPRFRRHASWDSIKNELLGARS